MRLGVLMSGASTVLLEVSDAGRELAVSPDRVRRLSDSGVLPVAARTPRGGRLFRAADVAALKAMRDERRRVQEGPAGA